MDKTLNPLQGSRISQQKEFLLTNIRCNVVIIMIGSGSETSTSVYFTEFHKKLQNFQIKKLIKVKWMKQNDICRCVFDTHKIF